MKKSVLMKYAACALAMGFVAAACSDDDEPNNGGGGQEVVDPKEVSFIVSSGDPTNDLSGGIVMRVFNDLSDATRTDQEVYTATGEGVTKSADCFTQVTYNKEKSVFTGFIYARAAASTENGGIGSLQAGLRSYKVADGMLTQMAGSPIMLSNFGNTGSFGTYSYAAQISNPYVKVLSLGDNAVTEGGGEIDLPLIAIDGVNPTVSNIVDMGNDQLALVLNYSNRDSAAVVFTDHTLAITPEKTVYDSRIGVSGGATRSVRYAQSGADDEGNVYVFSGNAVNDSRVGALRIKKGASAFDPDYHFNILQAADGYRFRKAFHISGDYFLLEFFVDKDAHENMSTSGRMAVVKMSDQSFKWVEGLPTDYANISIGWADGYDGVMYLPIAAATSMGGGSGSGGGRPQTKAESTVTPTIYAIDAATGKASVFMTFKNTDLLKAVTILK